MRDQYIKLKKSGQCESSILPHSPRGVHMLLGYLDTDVQNLVSQVRLQGGVINARVVMAGVEAIVTKHAKQKLERYGGHLTINKHYASSLLRCMGLVKRKGTKNVKQLPSDFEEIKASFIEKVSNVVKQHNIPDALVIYWDQTGVQMVPGHDWTMDEHGSQQVPITGLDNKRQITLVLAIAKDSTLLPPQFIYAGKTERCLPKLKDNGITPLFVAACCTDRLQPLDIAVNYDYKEALKAHFHEWYTQQVIDTLNNDDESTHTPDLKNSTRKPILAKWIVSAHAQMESRGDLVQTGFKKAGL